jgi:hypothetical protein
MIVDEIIANCSHPKIAGAALRSLGRAFVEEIGHDARANGLPPDAFVALLVRRFGALASPADRVAVAMAVKGHAMPVLEGLRRNHQGFCGDRSAARADGRVMIDRLECGATGLG